MKNMGIVYGNSPQALPLIVGKGTVYVHTNIQPVIEDGEIVEGLFSYNEVQYSLHEYIQLMAEGLADSDTFNVDHELRITLLELGVV